MSGVLEGRRLKFTADGEHWLVAAVAVSPVLTPQYVTLGRVLRSGRSTDSRIAGTRLRRVGKGAVAWKAEVPREHWEQPKNSRTGLPIPGRPRTAGQLQGTWGTGFRLEEFGESWDRRADAAEALVEWYDGKRAKP